MFSFVSHSPYCLFLEETAFLIQVLCCIRPHWRGIREEYMTCRQGRTKKLCSLHLACFTVFSSESFFTLVLIRAFQTLFISGSFCRSSPKGWRLQQWALPAAAAEDSRGFCPCFQRETATVVRVCLLSDATVHSLVHMLPCVLPKNYGRYCFYVRSWTAVSETPVHSDSLLLLSKKQKP